MRAVADSSSFVIHREAQVGSGAGAEVEGGGCVGRGIVTWRERKIAHR